jgi:pheromone shutdown-related protein TraB
VSEEITVGDTRITVLGTAHVSRASAEQVTTELESGRYDAVAVELCPSRHGAIVDPDALSRMDLFRVLREGKAPMVTASLALGAYQQRLAEQFGIEPGAEMRAAIAVGRQRGLPVLLIDREIGVTLRRVYRSVPWWQRLGLFGALLGSVVTRERIEEDEIERLKEGDLLETAFADFAAEAEALFVPLIEERDQYMAARLRSIAQTGEHDAILAVVGAGHVKGIAEALHRPSERPPEQVTAELDRLPKPARWPRVLPWVVVALVLSGFAWGFSRSPELGWQLVLDWVLINGGLAALGAALAGGHVLTVLSAFLAAPLTSLNPTIGAGFVTAGVETYLRRPNVGDFSRLRHDAARLSGWWRNRVARILLVFLFSTVGSALGTYVAGFRIFDRLTG